MWAVVRFGFDSSSTIPLTGGGEEGHEANGGEGEDQVAIWGRGMSSSDWRRRNGQAAIGGVGEGQAATGGQREGQAVIRGEGEGPVTT